MRKEARSMYNPPNAADLFGRMIYHDEQIPPPALGREETVPAPIRTIRELEKTVLFGRQSRELLFVKQARLMQTYEDDHPYTQPVKRFFPTYQSLTNAELRGYFTWRTELRKGNLTKAPDAYACLYCYELINQIGCDSPLDGFLKLSKFQNDYHTLNPDLDADLEGWLFDYVIYYNLDPSLLSDSPQVQQDLAVDVLFHLDGHPDEAIALAADQLAAGYLARSRFCGERKSEVYAITAQVCKKVRDYYKKYLHKDWTSAFVASLVLVPGRLFSSAVFYDGKKLPDRDYVVDRVSTYQLRRGIWSRHTPVQSTQQKQQLLGLLRTIDSLSREAFHYPHPIKQGLSTKWLLTLVREECKSYLDEQEKAKAPVVSIDFSRLDQIRRDAAVTQGKLAIGDEVDGEEGQETLHSGKKANGDVTYETMSFMEKASDDAAQETLPIDQKTDADAAQETSFTGANASPVTPDFQEPAPAAALLNKNEQRYLTCLLTGESTAWVKAAGLMPSVLNDSINEKLFDEFADNVLEDGEVVEDYREDLLSLFPGLPGDVK
ncbi:MAG: TerB N-terminal domain-containing protein [Lachnospiraceae bacterium]|nr:TerB N-terminal domain-containing protein [Lachnospiraceae bacterium]